MALIDRVKRMLLTPKEEWPVIDAEPATVGGLYTSYIIPLSAIGPIAAAIGWSLFGFGLFRLAVGALLKYAIVSYVGGLIGIFVLALIVDALAPTFGGQKNRTQALKVVAYSYTAFWVAGILNLIPGLNVLALLAGIAYTLYLLFLGLPVLMKAPQDKATGYTIVVIVVAIVVGYVIRYATQRLLWQGMIGGVGL
jgi:hypothetical protein